MTTKLMNVLLVDDEAHNRLGLRHILTEHCPEVFIVGEAGNAEQARQLISEQKVDILLLDIHMPKENGFELLESLTEYKFLTIFITAYTEYAIRAFKASAIDYILKPVDESELIAAIDKCRQLLLHINKDEKSWAKYQNALKQAAHDTETQSFPTKLTLPHYNGFQIVEIADIIYLEAEGNYTKLHFKSEHTILASKAIREFEEILDPKSFFRIHKSSMINMHCLKSYSSVDGYEVVLIDGTKLPVSRRRLDEFMSVIGGISRRL